MVTGGETAACKSKALGDKLSNMLTQGDPNLYAEGLAAIISKDCRVFRDGEYITLIEEGELQSCVRPRGITECYWLNNSRIWEQ
jgi:hypothetical protein